MAVSRLLLVPYEASVLLGWKSPEITEIQRESPKFHANHRESPKIAENWQILGSNGTANLKPGNLKPENLKPGTLKWFVLSVDRDMIFLLLDIWLNL